MAGTGTVKLVASIDTTTADILSTIMAEYDIPVAEALRRLVLIGHMMYSEKAAGRKIMTMNRDESDPAEIVLF
jgi:hypothetical protein